MNIRFSRGPQWLVLVAFFVASVFLQAKEYTLTVVNATDVPKVPGRKVFMLALKEGTGLTEDLPLVVTSAVTAPDSYVLQIKKHGKWNPIKIEEVVPNDRPHASQVRLRHDMAIDVATGEEFKVTLKKNVWKLTPGNILKTGDGEASIEIGKEVGEFDKKYLSRNAAFERKLQIQSGTSGGTASLRWSFFARDFEDEPSNDGYWNFRAGAKADITIPTEDKKDFFNRIEGELEFFYQSPWPERDSETNETERWRFYYDIGTRAGYEASGDFETQDFTLGVLARAIVGNPLTDYLATALIPKHPEVVVSPMFSLGYDWVSHQRAPDDKPEPGEQRLVGKFFWRWPLARQVDWLERVGIIDEKFDADLRIELEGVLDLDEDKFTDNSEISLEIRPSSENPKHPSFTLTYARGKAKPTYEHFDAFLAGFKLAW